MKSAVINQKQAAPSLPSDSSEPGEVYVIGLLMIRISSGVLWERTRQSISDRLRGILQRLAPEASFELAGADFTRCVVTFPAGSRHNADICVRAAYELIAGVMGQCEFSDIHVSRQERDAGGDVRQTRLASEELAAIVERTRLPDVAVPNQYTRKSAPGAKGRANRESAAPSHRPRVLSAEFRFEPVWDAQAQAVRMYMCSAKDVVSKDEDNAPVRFEDLTHKERALIDFDGALAGIEHLVKCVDRNMRFILNLPVGFETLASPSGRTMLTQICRGVLPVYRPYIIFTLTDIPVGVSATRLSDFVMLLRPFGRVTAIAAKGERTYSGYQNIGLHGIAADLTPGPDGEARPRSDIVNLAALGRSFKLGATLYGVSDPEIVAFALASDIRLFHGPCIGDGLGAPKGMTHLPRSTVLPGAESSAQNEWL